MGRPMKQLIAVLDLPVQLVRFILFENFVQI
jgi:hypothetical protein